MRCFSCEQSRCPPYLVILKILRSLSALSTLIPNDMPGLKKPQTTSKMLPTMTCKTCQTHTIKKSSPTSHWQNLNESRCGHFGRVLWFTRQFIFWKLNTNIWRIKTCRTRNHCKTHQCANVQCASTKNISTPFPTCKLVFIKQKYVVRMCAPYAYFRPGIHRVLAEIASGEMMRWTWNISWELWKTLFL